MGVEYAIVHEPTREAFELGKGPWWQWEGMLPKSFEDVRSLIEKWTGDWDTAPWLAYRIFLSNSIWTFIDTHPGCFVVNDCDDAYSWAPRTSPWFDSKRHYAVVGTRYNAALLEALG